VHDCNQTLAFAYYNSYNTSICRLQQLQTLAFVVTTSWFWYRGMRSELARGEGNRSVCGTDRELVEETAHRHCTRVGIATAERCSRVSAPPPRGHHRKWVVEGSVVHHSHEGQAWKGQRRILGREEPCRMGGGVGATDDAGVLSPLPWSSEARPVP
jgi:hypothetical protein